MQNLLIRGDESINPSDEVANGDVKEDLELEDERDVNDDVVQDNGFAVRSSWVQLSDNVGKKEEPTDDARYSEQLSNGDSKDDLELEDERDDEDYIV